MIKTTKPKLLVELDILVTSILEKRQDYLPLMQLDYGGKDGQKVLN